MNVTVSVVTYGRLPLLKRCVRSVLRCLPADSEVLITVNGEDNKALAWISTLGDPRLRYHVSERVSLSAARNGALRQARGKIVYCLDDDVYVTKDIFSQAATLFKEYPNAVCIGGPNLSPPNSSVAQRLFGDVMQSGFTAPGVRRRYIADGEGVRLASEFDLMFCNLAIYRERVPGGVFFREHLRSNQENRFIQDLERRGLDSYFFSKGYVYHERRATLRDFSKQIASYGEGRFQQMWLGTKAPHFVFVVPALCLSLAAVLAVSAPGRVVLLGLVAAHVGISFASALGLYQGAKHRFLKAAVLAPVSGIVHLAYGWGFWRGLFRTALSQFSARMKPPKVKALEAIKWA